MRHHSSLVCGVYALLASCGPAYTPDAPLGGRPVAVSIECLEPQRTWAADMVRYFGWPVVDAGEVAIVCGELPPGAAGEYVVGSSTVRVDPVRTPGELAVKQTVAHELIHYRIDVGPHRERALLHICDIGFGETAPVGCAPGFSAKCSVMSPAQCDPAVDYLTEIDKRFVAFALTP